MPLAIVLIALLVLNITVLFFIKRSKDNLKRQSLKNREEILEKERKIYDLTQKEREITNNFEKIKEIKLEEINNSLLKRNEEIQNQLNAMRLKQEQEIKSEIKAKKEKSLELYLKELNQEKEEIKKSHDEDIQKIKKELEDLRSIESAARNARIRDFNEKNEKDLHRLSLTEEDLKELKELNQIKLRNPLPLKKAIFDIYYREPVRALFNRVINKDKVSAVYKITLIETGQIYIGKSVDVERRWRDHIRRGIGADKRTDQILYDAFEKYGVHNFTFEILEEAPAAELNEREKYWIDYFESNKFGFNMRR